MSDIEKLKAFHQVSQYLPPEKRAALLNDMELPTQGIEQRLRGLTTEQEFALILYFLDCCKHIVAIDEYGSALTEASYQSDFLLMMNDGQKIFLEVKSQDTDHFKISSGNLSKRLEFARDIGYALYFAIRIGGFWTLITGNDLLGLEGKISKDDAIGSSSFASFFGCYTYLIPKGLRIESTYSKDMEDGPFTGIESQDYGHLKHYAVFHDSTLLFEIRPDNMEKLFFSICLEHVHDYTANHSMSVEEVSPQMTKTIETVDVDLLMMEYNFFLTSVLHVIDDRRINYNFTSYLRELAAKNTHAYRVDALRVVINELIRAGAPIKVFRGDPNMSNE